MANPNRRILAALLVALGPLVMPAKAADAPVYAVLSLVGDSLGIVVQQPSTGSHLDRNRRETPVPVTGDVFDGAVVLAIARAAAQRVPGAQFSALNTRSPSLFKDQHERFPINGNKLAWPSAIGDALSAQGATHLILVTRHRAATRIEFLDADTGSGSLEGLGFFVDGTLKVQDVDSQTEGTGFVAPYVYVRLALIEVASGQVLRTQTVTAASPVPATRRAAGIGNPWEALSPVEKVNAIRSLIAREMARAVPQLFQ